MQKAVNRFWDWLFHPSIRWYPFHRKTSWFRYPSPGSNIHTQTVHDYKTPYEYSQHNIRYSKPVQELVKDQPVGYVGWGPKVSVIDKLRATGLLQVGSNTQQQIQQAKKKYAEQFGAPVEQNTFINNLNIEVPTGVNRQQIRKFVQKSMTDDVNYNNQFGRVILNRKFIQQPQVVKFQSLDMFSEPHFQQTRIDVQQKLNNFNAANIKRGYIEIRKGEKSFWKALDNSNDPKNIQKVQSAIGDQQPNNFQLRDTRIQYKKDKNGKVTDVDPKTRSV